MSSTSIYLVLLHFFIIGSLSAKFPSGWKKCPKVDNEECLKTTIKEAITSLRGGNKALGIIPLNPLHFDYIKFLQGGNGPVSMNTVMNGLDITNEGNMTITSVKADWDKYKIEIEYDYIGTTRLEGNYSIEGKILVLPIQGKGYTNYTLVDCHSRVILTGSEKIIGGKKYFNVDKGEFLIYPRKASVYMSNLFNGSKELSDKMLKYLNDNWKEILNEVRGTISISIGEGLRQIANSFFTKIPLDQIYIS